VFLSEQFKNAPSGEDLTDVLKRVKFSSMAWTHDGKGLFYNVSLTLIILPHVLKATSELRPLASIYCTGIEDLPSGLWFIVSKT
jgi:hypothetical protein